MVQFWHEPGAKVLVIIPSITSHLIQIDDDFGQTKAQCSCHEFSFDSPNRAKKIAASYRHLADVLDPPEIETHMRALPNQEGE